MVLTAEGPKPYLAASVTPNATFDEWTIDLPSGVTFHDGTDLTADVVKQNFDDRLGDDLMGPLLAPVQDVSVDGADVVVKMRTPWPAFPVALTGQSGLIAAAATLADDGSAGPIGTGPYKWGTWTKGKTITVKKNTSYWKPDRPHLDGITFSIMSDPELRRVAMHSGDLDVIQTDDPHSVDDLGASFGVVQAKTAEVTSVIFNTKDGPATDAKLRQALSDAVDRQVVVDQVYSGKATPATSLFPSGSPLLGQWQGQGYDESAAKQLVSSLGANPSIELLVGTSSRQQQIASILSSAWKAIGVAVTVTKPDDGDTLSKIVDGSFQAALWTYDAPTDPDESFVWFHTDATPKQFTYNLPRWSNGTNDTAWQDGRAAAATDKRQDAYDRVANALADQVPALWMAFLPEALISSSHVAGWQPATIGGFGRGGTPWATDIGFAP
jgi:ABC-type transport system substrate-binding protein